METHTEMLLRFKRILESFLDENFSTNNTVYFEKLITHLSAKENAYILQAPFALDWIERCITIVNEDFEKINPKVISFMLNLFGLLTRNEWIVLEIRERKLVDKVVSIVRRDCRKFNPSMKLGTIRMLSSVCAYSLGLGYIRSSKSWQFLIDYCNQDHTLYVVREARNLLYELIYKFSVKTKDEQVVISMLDEILKPIHENVFEEHDDKITINVDDHELQHKLASSLDLISYIFQKTLESEEKTNIAHLCLVNHNIEVTIWKLTEMTHNQHFLEKILIALSSFSFARLVYEKWTDNGQISPENFNEFGITIFNMMKFCVSRRECINFVKLAEVNYILWKKLGDRAPKEIQIENERVCLENQLITFHLLPIHFIVKSKEFLQEELFEKYFMKFFDFLCEHTIRICYSYRDVLFSITEMHVTADLAYKSIHSILSMENFLERDHAVLVFQALIYALKEFVLNSDDANKEKGKSVLILEIPNVLYAALIALQTLIQRYKITWKESIETICLVNLVLSILENPNLTSRMAIQAIKLVQLSIEHFLSPNMALLVDNLQGSALICLGPIIVKRFHDPTWEVRDSILELVNSIANISHLKFPAFQRFLVDYKICPLVFQMAKNDGEPYVRVSALKCLSEFVQINLIWENDLSKLNLIEHLFFVLYNESEGMVRKEAVCTLATIYEHRKIPSRYKDTLYSTLAYCVVADLYWEVKVNALYFWKLEIKKQFTNQGMIDGTFPTVTFSKENKKIVTLTTKEINLRIIKILNDLSQRGCLGVILKCLNDDCDLEVVKVAMAILTRLLLKLKQYDYESIIDSMELSSNNQIINSCECNSHGPKESLNMKMEENENAMPDVAIDCQEKQQNNINPTTTTDQDVVIEDILASQDINLLVSAYETQMQLNGEDKEETRLHIDEHFYKKFASVSAKEFMIALRRIDFDQISNKNQEWFLSAESFGSLLDDILVAIEPDDEEGPIFADCY